MNTLKPRIEVPSFWGLNKRSPQRLLRQFLRKPRGAALIMTGTSIQGFGVESFLFPKENNRVPEGISKETVISLQHFSLGPRAVLGGAYMLVRDIACSRKGV